MIPPHYVSTTHAAGVLCLKPVAVRALIARGHLPAMRGPGRTRWQWWIDPADLERALLEGWPYRRSWSRVLSPYEMQFRRCEAHRVWMAAWRAKQRPASAS